MRGVVFLTGLLLLATLASGQVAITTPSLPDGYINGIFYSQALAVTITPPLNTNNTTLSWSITAGALPPNLNLNTTTGAITGSPTTTGTYNFKVMVQINFTGFTDQRQFSITINTPRITIVTDTPLPNVALTENYQVTLQATSLPALAVQWTVSPTALPPGLTMNAQGTISGIPQTTGTYSFLVGALLANTGVVDSKTFTITVFAGRLKITSPSPLPTATVGVPYSYTLTSLPGAGVTWGSVIATPALPGIKLDSATGILSGIPPITGSFSFVISAAAAGFTPDSKTFSFFVIGGPLSITETSLPLAILSAPYSVPLHATGGLAPYLWRLTGSPPPGLTIDLNTGLLSGRPTAVGQYSFVVEATDATGTKVIQPFNIFVAGPVIIITGSLPNAVAGAAYNQVLMAGGGQPPYTWSILSGDIPPGLQFSSSGILTGAPTRNGFFQFTVQVSDNGQRTATSTLSITVGGIAVSTASLPDAGFGVAYLQNLQTLGGNAPFTWTLIGGSLPPGLSLDPSGALQGTPAQTGNFQFTVQVTDATQSVAQKQLSMNVVLPLGFFTTSLPGGGVGNAYSQTLSAQGGTPPYTFTVELGSLPPGLSLDAATGTISGTPTTQGSYTFGILLTDKAVQQVHKSFTIVIGGSISITTGNLSGTAGTAFSQTLVVSGGTGPFIWSVTSGNLPSGLTLNGSTGVISGTPTAAGSFPITLSVTDSKNATAQQSITVTITLPATPTVTITLTPDTSAPAQQPVVGVTLASAYPVDIMGTLALTFTGSSDDQTVGFSSMGVPRSVFFTIDAGSTQARITVLGISNPNGPVALLTGTVAGTITLSATLKAGSIDITPSPTPTKTVTIAPSAPVISSVVLQSSGTSLTVIVTGYSTTRDMVSGLFHFAPASGSTLSQSDLTVQLGPAFSTWYGSPVSNRIGSQFALTMPFSVSQGTAASITAVTVTLTNSKGTSPAVSP